MKAKIVLTTGDAYRNFEVIFSKVEKWISSLSLKVDLCDEMQVKRRALQKLVEVLSPAVISSRIELDPNAETMTKQSKLKHRNFSLDVETGKAVLSLAFFLYQCSAFLYLWGRLLVTCVLRICISKARKTVPATFLFEAGGDYESGDAGLINFCANGPVLPLREARRLIIYSSVQPAKQVDTDNVVYCENPLIGYFRSSMSKADQLGLLISHLRAPIIFFKALMHNPVLVVLSVDFAYLPAYAFLSRRSLIKDLIITNSRFVAQPLWMKGMEKQGHRLHMMWYSQNFIPKKYIGEELGSNLPSARHIRVDVHWVWTAGFKQYLTAIGQESEIHVVGPLLWYLRTPKKTRILDGDYSVVLFDVTPIKPGANVFGALFNYYSYETISKFVADSISACNYLRKKYGVQLIVYLKHKRSFSEIHDSRYANYIEGLSKKISYFRIINYNASLYDVIGESDLSIAVPYTSTANVSSAIMKNAIYYDALGTLVPAHEVDEFISYASNYSSLVNQVEEKLFGVKPGSV
jgi:hypothetical protein